MWNTPLKLAQQLLVPVLCLSLLRLLQQRKCLFSFLGVGGVNLDGATSDDLDDLSGNLGLPAPVVKQSEVLLELLGIVAGTVHGVHPCRELRGEGLLERPQDGSVHVERQEGVQDLLGLAEQELVDVLGHEDHVAVLEEVEGGPWKLKDLATTW